ncbi:MAG: pyrimidine 5-nucleotidase [Candidatus Sumerlaeota bacterium]|nr:pyrimidine 5-nucleotidase [Candidatus Sumerlaeota bacterium]
MASELKWLFFDVGGTIFDEEPVYKYQEDVVFDLLNRHCCDVKEKEFASAVRAARRYYLPRYIHHLIWIFTEEPSLYEKVSLAFEKQMNKTSYKKYRELVQLLPGMKDMLMDLGQRYALGIIGNQPAMVRQRLEEEGMIDLFHVHAISQEMALRKPDLRFFQSALAMAHCTPEESAMIGDRLDNDIYPARVLGMTTVRLKIGPHRHQPVLSPEYLPHYTVKSTHALAKLLLGTDFHGQGNGPMIVW